MNQQHPMYDKQGEHEANAMHVDWQEMNKARETLTLKHPSNTSRSKDNGKLSNRNDR
ncbi:MAG: hypothetical protein ACXWAT_00185 [Methylobacter sp.]